MTFIAPDGVKNNKSSKAYWLLRNLIDSGEVGAGQRLTEAKAARLTGMGRGPVRESFLRLRTEGILSQSNDRCVHTVVYAEERTREEILHLTVLHAHINIAAAEESAIYMSGRHIAQSRKLAQVADDLVAEEDHSPQERTNATAAFFSYLHAHCGNPLIPLVLQLPQLRPSPTRTQKLENARRLNRRDLISMGDVVEAIATHDSALAGEVMSNHLKPSIDVWRKLTWDIEDV